MSILPAEITSSPSDDFFIDFHVVINDEPCELYYCFIRPRCLLIDSDDATSRYIMSAILSQMMVPFHARLSIMQEFLTRAREIASQPENINRKTIHLVVRITVEPPPPADHDDDDDDDDLPFLRLTDGVMDCKETCAICLEEYCGNAVQLRACDHIFHENCIVKWFDKSCACPLCRCSVYAI